MSFLNKTSKIVTIFLSLLLILLSLSGCTLLDDFNNNNPQPTQVEYHSNNSNSSQNVSLKNMQFNMLVSDEMKDLEVILKNHASSQGYTLNIDYAGTLDIMERLNSNQKYDAIWASNSIWTYMVDSKVAALKNSKITYVTPIVFGIKKSKAEELGFVGKTVYTKDLVDAISEGKLKFIMSNPTTTDSGASAYLGMLYTLAGNPEILTEDILQDPNLKVKIKAFFRGVERTAGTQEFLEDSFVNGDYEAAFTYEFSIMNINKKLEADGKEPLYVVYPVDGVAISDNPIVYIDNKDDAKELVFNDLKQFIVSKEGQDLLKAHGRRTWYGGLTDDVDQTLFNPDWGINTNSYINPVNYPASNVIKDALSIYQSAFRKPIHVIFCLDFSGSMYGEGYSQLKDAMEFILSEQAAASNLQFTDEDIVEIIPFATQVYNSVVTNDGSKTQGLIDAINARSPYGGTNIYGACQSALKVLSQENQAERNTSIILMTDGQGNVGKYYDLKNTYQSINKEIPIYSIMFGDADSTQLGEIAKLTNAKVFDGRTNLLDAFREVRGYN